MGCGVVNGLHSGVITFSIILLRGEGLETEGCHCLLHFVAAVVTLMSPDLHCILCYSDCWRFPLTVNCYWYIN